MFEELRTMVVEVAPRGRGYDLEPDTDLGYGGWGMTVVEYTILRSRVELRWGVRFGPGVWPHRLSEFVGVLTTSGPEPGENRR